MESREERVKFINDLEETLRAMRNSIFLEKEDYENTCSNVIEKMTQDYWGNVIMLKNGWWFIAGEIKKTYTALGHEWIEFSGTKEFKGSDAFYRFFPEDRDLSNAGCRNIAVKVSEISFIGEGDS